MLILNVAFPHGTLNSYHFLIWIRLRGNLGHPLSTVHVPRPVALPSARHSFLRPPPTASPFPRASLENSVLAEPRVDCSVDSIGVWIRTEKPFRGRLYVEDESENAECVRSYAHEEEGGPGAEFSLRFGHCNMRRQRLLNPRGVTYSFTLVISFHPVFLTGIDRAFNIKCFFMEAVKALDASMDVSPLSTTVVEREFSLPQCSYTLRHSVEGPLLKYASIGEPVTHVWQCDPVAGWLYGMLIHSCFVDDGHGNRFELVNDRGCATDSALLAHIAYDEKAFAAYANTHVFRYADRVQLFFTCTVQLCFREDGGCEGISPPQCRASGPSPLPPNLNSHGPFLRHDVDTPSYRGPPPFKDSPLSANGTDEGDSAERSLADQVLLSMNRSRTGRDAGGEGVRMESDLNADLTVVPHTKDPNGGREEQNPFVRVLAIKSNEYGSPLSAHLDSQRLGSFEMLAVAGATFGATITVTALITTICLQRCRVKKLLGRDPLY